MLLHCHGALDAEVRVHRYRELERLRNGCIMQRLAVVLVHVAKGLGGYAVSGTARALGVEALGDAPADDSRDGTDGALDYFGAGLLGRRRGVTAAHCSDCSGM